MAGAASEDNPVGINVTALVDIIFCLCLFFMCSLKFRELDGQMDAWLPKDVGINKGDAPASPRDEMRVLLSKNESTGETERLYDRRPISDDAAGDALLRRLLHEDARTFRERGILDCPLIIDAGERVSWSEVVAVMDMARSEDINRIEFGVGSEMR
jgi:biopolymer transport protein ExbD